MAACTSTFLKLDLMYGRIFSIFTGLEWNTVAKVTKHPCTREIVKGLFNNTDMGGREAEISNQV